MKWFILNFSFCNFVLFFSFLIFYSVEYNQTVKAFIVCFYLFIYFCKCFFSGAPDECWYLMFLLSICSHFPPHFVPSISHLASGSDNPAQLEMSVEICFPDCIIIIQRSSHRIKQQLCCITSLAGLGRRSMDNPRIHTHCNSDETFLLQQMSVSINNELKDSALCEILIYSQETLPLERKRNGVLVRVLN